MTNDSRVVRIAPPPLGLYLRAAGQDRQALLELVAEQRMHCNGLVVDPRWDVSQAELIRALGSSGLDVVLDPRIMEIDSIGGTNQSLSRLPWAPAIPRTPQDLLAGGGQELVRHLANRVCDRGYTAVLAPTHFVVDANDPWLSGDVRVAGLLREELDRRGRSDVPIFYPLAITRQVLVDHDQRQAIISELEDLPIAAVWLRVHPFGGRSGPLALRTVIEACTDFRCLGIPIVAERVGGAGLPMLAFGAISGIAAGIGTGENFDAGRLLRPANGAPGFLPQRRVYIADLGISLEPSLAAHFFMNQRVRAQFACRHTECCRLGAEDMVAHPRRHFSLTKMREIAALSRIPPRLRPSEYMERVLRPATDRLIRAARLAHDAELQGRIAEARTSLEKWRSMLGRLLDAMRQPLTAPPPPELRIVRTNAQRH